MTSPTVRRAKRARRGTVAETTIATAAVIAAVTVIAVALAVEAVGVGVAAAAGGVKRAVTSDL
jgi:hypothetical protein